MWRSWFLTSQHDPPALRALLTSTEDRLSQTLAELAAARLTIAERDAAITAATPAGEAASLHDGAGTAGRRGTGGAAAGGSGVIGRRPSDGIGGSGSGTTPAAGADGAADGATGDGGSAARPVVFPTPAAGRAEDYDHVGDGEGSESPSDWYAHANAARAGRGGLPRHAQYTDDVAVYNDGFDTIKVPAADEWLQAFDVPRSILRANGMPVPFSPDDNVHASTFPANSRDEQEARHWYCILAWLQLTHNEALDSFHATGRDPEEVKQLLEYLLCSINRTYAIGVSRYDYLALRQSEPALAEAFAHSDAVPRNTLRGDGARRYLSRVVRQETHASAKIGAAERGFSYGNRAPPRSTGNGAASGADDSRRPRNGGAGRASGSNSGNTGLGGGRGGSGGSNRGRSGGRGGRGGSRA